MRPRRPSDRRRRGSNLVETAVVLPVSLMLIIGTYVIGLEFFRYHQVATLAREGARYASVHGPNYASEQNSSYATSDTVLTYVETLAVGMKSGDLSCTLTWNPSPPTASSPSTVTVTVTYAWTPEAYFSKQAVNLTASSTMPVVY